CLWVCVSVSVCECDCEVKQYVSRCVDTVRFVVFHCFCAVSLCLVFVPSLCVLFWGLVLYLVSCLVSVDSVGPSLGLEGCRYLGLIPPSRCPGCRLLGLLWVLSVL